MTQSATGLWSLKDEPWYVIVGLIVCTAVALWVQSMLEKRDWWPYKGDNLFVDQLIWAGVLFAIVVPVALIAAWLL